MQLACHCPSSIHWSQAPHGCAVFCLWEGQAWWEQSWPSDMWGAHFNGDIEVVRWPSESGAITYTVNSQPTDQSPGGGQWNFWKVRWMGRADCWMMAPSPPFKMESFCVLPQSLKSPRQSVSRRKGGLGKNDVGSTAPFLSRMIKLKLGTASQTLAARGSQVQGHLQSHNKFNVSLDYTKLSQKI